MADPRRALRPEERLCQQAVPRAGKLQTEHGQDHLPAVPHPRRARGLLFRKCHSGQGRHHRHLQKLYPQCRRAGRPVQIGCQHPEILHLDGRRKGEGALREKAGEHGQDMFLCCLHQQNRFPYRRDRKRKVAGFRSFKH